MNANSQIAQSDLDRLAAKINSANNRMRTKFRDWILEVDGYLQEAKSQLKGADFLQWCETQLLWKKSRVYQIMDSAKVMQTLVDADMAGDFLPQSESWCRQLQRLPEELPEHWSKYLEQYDDDKRTAATVKQYVDDVLGPKVASRVDNIKSTQRPTSDASSVAIDAIQTVKHHLKDLFNSISGLSNSGTDCQQQRKLLAQAYQECAFVILHDGSLDDTTEMLDDFIYQCSLVSQPPAAVTVDAVDVAPSVKGAKVTEGKPTVSRNLESFLFGIAVECNQRDKGKPTYIGHLRIYCEMSLGDTRWASDAVMKQVQLIKKPNEYFSKSDIRIAKEWETKEVDPDKFSTVLQSWTRWKVDELFASVQAGDVDGVKLTDVDPERPEPALDITYRDSASKEMQEQFPQLVADGIAWMQERYPDVDFDGIKWELAGGKIGSWYDHKEKKILICHGNGLHFYARAAREIPKLKESVGEYSPAINAMGGIIHELTHHAQRERNFHKGNETDTTLNELAWLQEHQPAIYKRCFTGKAPVVSHATIKPRKRGEPLPAYLCKPPKRVGPKSQAVALRGTAKVVKKSEELDIATLVKPHEVQPIKVVKFLKSLQWNVPYYQDVFQKRGMPQLTAWRYIMTARGFEKRQMYGYEIVRGFFEHVGAEKFYEIDDDKDSKHRTSEMIDTLAKYFRSRRWKETVEQSKEPAKEVA